MTQIIVDAGQKALETYIDYRLLRMAIGTAAVVAVIGAIAGAIVFVNRMGKW